MFVQKYSQLDQDFVLLNNEQIRDTTRKELYKLAHCVYTKSRFRNKNRKFPVLSECIGEFSENKSKTEALTILSGLALGSIGAVGLTAGLMSPVVIVSSLIGGVVVTSYWVKPYLKEYFTAQSLMRCIEELNAVDTMCPDERMYEEALNRLNLFADSDNETVKDARQYYLRSFNLRNINGDETKLKRYFELEKNYKIIKKYRMDRNAWD
jgi:hypothetical protein